MMIFDYFKWVKEKSNAPWEILLALLVITPLLLAFAPLKKSWWMITALVLITLNMPVETVVFFVGSYCGIIALLIVPWCAKYSMPD